MRPGSGDQFLWVKPVMPHKMRRSFPVWSYALFGEDRLAQKLCRSNGGTSCLCHYCYTMTEGPSEVRIRAQVKHHIMISHKRLQLKTYLAILVMVLAGPLGNLMLGKGMKNIGRITTRISSPSTLGHVFAKILGSGTIWLGIGALLTFFVAYMLVLSWADYSYVQPASSMAYPVVALLATLLLGEVVSPLRWVGIAIICLGVFVVGHTNPRTTGSP
jgi:hypothetical protein